MTRMEELEAEAKKLKADREAMDKPKPIVKPTLPPKKLKKKTLMGVLKTIVGGRAKRKTRAEEIRDSMN